MGYYYGEVMTYCPADLDFSTVYAVVVSGDFPNPCGHALLFVPSTTTVSSGAGGYYFQTGPTWYTVPKILDEGGYQRYLSESGKSEITRYAVNLPNPDGAINRLIDLMLKPWTWLVLPHNCAAFVEDIVSAGGSSAGLYSNCPRLEDFN